MDRKWVQLLILSIFLASASCLRFPRRANYASGVAPMNFERKDDSKSTDTQYMYTVNGEEEEIPCILANMNVTMTIPNPSTNEPTGSVPLAIPEEATASGVCGGVVSTMSLKWGPKDKSNTVTFTFVNDHAKFSVLQIVVDIFVEAKGERLKKSSKIDLHLFAAPVENGLYNCKELLEVPVGDIMLNFENVSLIAFNKQKDTSKRTSVDCPAELNDKSFPYALQNSEDNHPPCVLAKMKISLRVPYETKLGKMSKRILNVPENATVSGNCDSESVFPQMMLSWKVAEENVTKSVDVENKITLIFSRFSRNTFLQGAIVNVFLDKENFPDAMYPGSRQTEITRFDVSPTQEEAGIYNCPKGFADNIKNISMSVSDILIIYNDKSSSFLLLSEVECLIAGITSESFIYKLPHPKTNIPCILANMTVSVEVPYKTESNEKTAILKIPADASVSGNCSQYLSFIDLSWTEKSEKDAEETNKVTFYLWNDLEKFSVYQVTFDIYYDSKNFPNAIDKRLRGWTKSDLILFDAPVDEGLYKCKDQPQKLEGHNIDLTIQDVALIAFNDNENLLLRQVKECDEDENNPDTTSTSESTTTPSSTSETTSTSESTTTPSSTSETTSTSESTTTPSSTSKTTLPAPSGNEYMYIVSDPETEVPCILANMSIFLRIPYEKKDSKSAEVILKVPAKADVSGICGIVESNMVVSWVAESKNELRSDKKDNELTFTFLKDSSDFYLYSVRMKIQLDETHFPDAANATFEDASSGELKLFSAPVDTGLYKCDPETVVDAKKAVMTITEVVLIAFNTDKTLSSKSETNCVAGANVGAIVGGIIGGLILLGVIIMAVVMYRRRRGY